MHDGFKWLVISDLDQLDKFREILGLGTCLSFADAFEKISADYEAELKIIDSVRIAMHPDGDVGEPRYLRDMEKARRRAQFVENLATAKDGPATYYTLLDQEDVEAIKTDARSITIGFVRPDPLGKMRFKYKIPEATPFLAKSVATLLDGEFTLLRRGVDVWPHLPTDLKLEEVHPQLPERTWTKHDRDLNGINTWFSEDIDVLSLMVREGEVFVEIIAMMPTTFMTKEQILEQAQLLYLDSGKEVIFDSRYEEHMKEASALDPAPLPEYIYTQ